MRNRNESCSRVFRADAMSVATAFAIIRSPARHDCVAVPLAELLQGEIYIKLVFSSAASYVFTSEQKSHTKKKKTEFNIDSFPSRFVLVNEDCVAIDHQSIFNAIALCLHVKKAFPRFSAGYVGQVGDILLNKFREFRERRINEFKCVASVQAAS